MKLELCAPTERYRKRGPDIVSLKLNVASSIVWLEYFIGSQRWNYNHANQSLLYTVFGLPKLWAPHCLFRHSVSFPFVVDWSSSPSVHVEIWYILATWCLMIETNFEEHTQNWLVVWNIFIFPYIGDNHPSWLIFFRGVETTNQRNVNRVVFCFPGAGTYQQFALRVWQKHPPPCTLFFWWKAA